ncbi:MAG: cytochrome c biogenesis protein CcsA [Deltaproteobacteria bacterium]|nr:cytochrome c biogenesis protein CcsA [Deltaproteobacteria bacterium]
MKGNTPFRLLALLCTVGFAIAPLLVFIVAPIEPMQGFIQKIFYFHVPCAWSMFLGGILSGIGGGLYLFTRGKRGEALTLVGAELAVLFGLLVMTTGPLWARVAWGHYWVWDVRLTTSALVFLTFIAVLVGRRFSGVAGPKVAAGLALFGAINVPFVYISVRIWSAIHPKTSVVPTLTGKMRLAFFVSLATFTLLFALIMWIRLRIHHSEQRLDTVMLNLQEAEANMEAPR